MSSELDYELAMHRLLCCFQVVVGRSFIENYKKFPSRYLAESDAKGDYPG